MMYDEKQIQLYVEFGDKCMRNCNVEQENELPMVYRITPQPTTSQQHLSKPQSLPVGNPFLSIPEFEQSAMCAIEGSYVGGTSAGYGLQAHKVCRTQQ